jgi:phytanoyl-CoA hydroxylase
MISDEMAQAYQRDGVIVVPQVLDKDTLTQVRTVLAELVAGAAAVSEHTDVYDLEPGHTPDNPRVRRIKAPHKVHPIFDQIVRSEPVISILTKLIGPGLRLHGSKLNMKSAQYGSPVEWHQDWAFYPHTNDRILACGLMLEDVDLANGPLQVIPGSHKGPVLSHNNKSGIFCGAIDPDDPDFQSQKAVTLTGKAGSMTVHHARTLHGSAPNRSDRARLILFYECLAADAWPLAGAGSYFHRLGAQEFLADLAARTIIGEPSLSPRMEAVPVRLPLPPAPDAGSIFKTQKTGGAKTAFAA